MEKAKDKILIVDDDKDMLDILSSLISSEGYEAVTAGDGRKALKEIRAHSPDVVLLDLKLPEMDGLKVMEEIKKIDKNLIVIMLTGYGEVKSVVQAMKLGAFDYITKPFDNEEIMLNIKKALESRYLRIEVEALRRRLEEKTNITKFIAECPKVKHILNQIKVIAPANITVIIQGESGTGKELVARMIHQESPRYDKPFIAVDCGAIPETLIESELFGYEKGAFTGADVRKEGKFEAANEGTLFLDEITNLPYALQAKLLRVIQERKVQHLGGTKEIKIDVRIIAATNAILLDEVQKGRFRKDLYYRLNEFNINLLPLREMEDNIPYLAKYFMEEANREFNKMRKGISGEAMKLLLNYSWPGNTRELRNVIRRAVLLSESEYILPNHLSIEASIIRPQDEVNVAGALCKKASFEEVTMKAERDLIKSALEQTGNNITKTAEILQMNRKTLYRKLKRLGL